MTGGISFAEFRAIANYLKTFEGGYIEKNYLSSEGVSFKFRKSGLNSIYLHIMGNEFLFLSEDNIIEGKKNLIPVENLPIESIRQVGTDRILEISGSKRLIIEMMAGGNIYVLNNEIIEYIRKPSKHKNVLLQMGERYSYPDYLDLEDPSFPLEARIRESTRDPIRTLGARLGLSKYAEEIMCTLSGEITDNYKLVERSDEIISQIKEILASANECKIYIYRENFFVWKSKCIKEEPETLNIVEGLKRVYELSMETGPGKEESIRRSVEKMTLEMERFRKMGEIVFSNMDEVSRLLSSTKNRESNGARVDYDKGIVYFKKEEMEIPLKLRLSAGENAEELFNSSKKIKDKLSRVVIKREEKTERVQRKKIHRVFANYRWFITRDGNLVLAGKDAETNDSVVKKYLDENDLYFHADIHGAPSVVMKVRNPVSEEGIAEAGNFAWCMSKAWNAGFGNGSVYYVTRSQVSKTPESGEYLARGAWIIRGKKNYVTHIDLEIAIGFQKYENRDYVVSGPPSSVQGKKIIVVPGEKKEEIVEEIADFLQVEKEAVYPVLPPGGCEIKERISS